MGKLWEAGEDGELDPVIEQFLSSIKADVRLIFEDIECSQAHTIMLGEQGIISLQDASLLVDELAKIRKELEAGSLSVDLCSEDVHSFLEEELTRRLGDVGKSIHAGRSRNDQVAVAFKLHIRNSCIKIEDLIKKAICSCLELAEQHINTLMPGYTHLQRAQPVSFAHHLLAWCAALERDAIRFHDAGLRADESPLGAGALAGSGLPIDRARTASLIGFSKTSANTMDAVADRDAAVDYGAGAAILMMHLSRFCEDISLWASSEYGFIRISSRASTGSSIMPQKRNPDAAELIRGKAGRVFGDLQALLVMEKGLPYAYNRDLQEDKSLFFDIEDTVEGSLKVFAVLVQCIEPNIERMRSALEKGHIEATDVAEFLVIKGIPFRTAYQAAKRLVEHCIEEKKSLRSIAQADLAVHEAFNKAAIDTKELAEYLDPVACVARRSQIGGPAPARVAEQIERLRRFIAP
ncbi:MAG TPA: argininosuccinate lyase [Rectinema sp.]|nr:argininosuccinate lyase [Rectinema sp.]